MARGPGSYNKGAVGHKEDLEEDFEENLAIEFWCFGAWRREEKRRSADDNNASKEPEHFLM